MQTTIKTAHPVARAIEVSHAVCKYEFRGFFLFHSRGVFSTSINSYNTRNETSRSTIIQPVNTFFVQGLPSQKDKSAMYCRCPFLWLVKPLCSSWAVIACFEEQRKSIFESKQHTDSTARCRLQHALRHRWTKKQRRAFESQHLRVLRKPRKGSEDVHRVTARTHPNPRASASTPAYPTQKNEVPTKLHEDHMATIYVRSQHQACCTSFLYADM